MYNNRGFTLIELIIFIVVMGIVVVAVMVPLNTASEKSPNPSYQNIATQLAQERMELILGQAYMFGFANFQDPCSVSPPPACSPPAGFVVIPSITTISTGKEITVTATATGQGATATLIARVGDY